MKLVAVDPKEYIKKRNKSLPFTLQEIIRGRVTSFFLEIFMNMTKLSSMVAVAALLASPAFAALPNLQPNTVPSIVPANPTITVKYKVDASSNIEVKSGGEHNLTAANKTGISKVTVKSNVAGNLKVSSQNRGLMSGSTTVGYTVSNGKDTFKASDIGDASNAKPLGTADGINDAEVVLTFEVDKNATTLSGEYLDTLTLTFAAGTAS